MVRAADIKRDFSKGDSANYSYKLYTITKVLSNTIPRYRFNYLTERYNENLILQKKLSIEKKYSSYEETKFNSLKKTIKNGIN